MSLSWFDAGVRSFYTREKVETLADLAGLTLRVQESDMMSEMILDLGAKPRRWSTAGSMQPCTTPR